MKTNKLILIMIFILVISGCSAKPVEPIRIGVNDWPPCEVWYIAEELGYFGDVPVDIIRFSAWSDNMNSLYLGKIDITHSTYFNTVYYFDRGEHGQLIAPIDFIDGSDGLVVHGDINTFKESQKRIAVEIGTDEHFLMYKALENFGIKIEDTKIVSTTSKGAADKFIEKSVDAAFTYEPYLSEAAKNGNGEIVFTTSDLPGYMVDVLVADEFDINERPEVYEKIMKAWYKALIYIKENPDEAYEIMAKNENMTKEDFKVFFEYFHFYNLEEAHQLIWSESMQDYMEEMHTFALANKLIIETEPVEHMIRKDILEEIIKE